MAEKLLTDAKVRAARGSEKERLLSDGSGLFLRVRATGKDWLFIYSMEGKRRKQGLGSYPEVTLERAREKASLSRSAVADGKDAINATAQAKKAQKAAEAALAARMTVRQLFEAWFSAQVVTHKDGGDRVKRIVEKDVLPTMGDRFADEVTRADVMRLLDRLKARGLRRSVNVLLQILRQMFWYGLAREIIRADPTASIERKDAGGRENERTRILAPEEIAGLASALSKAGVIPSTQDAVWLLLGTCARLGELVKAKWGDFDEAAGTWLIPAENSKNGRPHLVHLSGFAKRHLRSLRAHSGSAVWLYPNPKGTGPMWPSAIQRQFRDRQMSPEKGLKSRNAVPQSLVLKGGTWTCHDLRRTGATMMGELGVRSDVIDRVLNHVEPRKVTRTYQRQELMAERKAAMEILGQRLDLITSKSDNVVVGDFRRAG